MHIAIVSATNKEMIDEKALSQLPYQFSYHIHGVGLLSSTFYLTELAQSKPDLIIQIGIAGSYTSKIKIGQVVLVSQEELGDTGAETESGFLKLNQLFTESNKMQDDMFDSFKNPFIQKFGLEQVKGLTVNTCAGRKETIQSRISLFHADIESMEGASLHFVCLKKNIPFLQIRGISNMVEIRDKSSWDIALAIKNCHLSLYNIIKELSLIS